MDVSSHVAEVDVGTDKRVVKVEDNRLDSSSHRRKDERLLKYRTRRLRSISYNTFPIRVNGSLHEDQDI